jgi:uncharacterized membrane protein YuzA (DUF378 family)
MAMCKVGCFLGQLVTAIGAINWGLVAFLNFNLVDYIDGLTGNVGVGKGIYGVVALCGTLSILSMFMSCKGCSSSSCKPQ